jgi:hypothetical protein
MASFIGPQAALVYGFMKCKPYHHHFELMLDTFYEMQAVPPPFRVDFGYILGHHLLRGPSSALGIKHVRKEYIWAAVVADVG